MHKNYKIKFLGFFLICCFAFLTSSCEKKTKLPGKRENISFSVTDLNKLDYDISKVMLGYSFIAPTECLKQNFTNSNQYDGILSTLKLKQKWSVSFLHHGTKDIPLSSNVLVIKNRVFIADGAGTVYSIDANTGKIIWKTKTSDKDIALGTFIGYNNANSLYVTTSFCDFFVIDIYSGKIKSVKNLPSPVKCPVVVHDNNLFMLSNDNKISCYGVRNLESMWEYAGIYEDAGIVGLAEPAIDRDTIVVTSKGGEIFALNAKNGSLFWDHAISKTKITDASSFITHIKASPVIYNGNVYVVSNVGKVSCLSLDKGEMIWTNNDFGGVKTPFLSGNAMFMIDSYSDLVALNNKTGKVFWRINLNTANSVPVDNGDKVISWFGPIVTSEGVVAFSEKGECLFFSHTNGKLIKKVKLESSIVAAPLLLKDKMILVTNSRIICFQ